METGAPRPPAVRLARPETGRRALARAVERPPGRGATRARGGPPSRPVPKTVGAALDQNTVAGREPPQTRGRASSP